MPPPGRPAADSVDSGDVDGVDGVPFGPASSGYRVMLVGNGEWQVREVFYDAAVGVAGWSPVPASLWGVDEDDLAAVFARVAEAFSLPPLVESDLPGYR